MAAIKVTLIKDWQHPAGKLKKKGAVLEVTKGLKKELEEGGFIESPIKKIEKKVEFKKDK
jgi:hypothetical protein